MNSKFLIAMLLAIGFISAEETTPKVEQQFGYVSAGLGPFPCPIPTFSGGYRVQRGHHGADVSMQVETLIAVTQVKANILYHHYFKPSLQSQFYAGGGVGPSYLFGCREHGWVISPEFVVGKQYRNESNDLRFFQAQVSFPTITLTNSVDSRTHVFKFPLMIISYGLGF